MRIHVIDQEEETSVTVSAEPLDRRCCRFLGPPFESQPTTLDARHPIIIVVNPLSNPEPRWRKSLLTTAPVRQPCARNTSAIASAPSGSRS